MQYTECTLVNPVDTPAAAAAGVRIQGVTHVAKLHPRPTEVTLGEPLSYTGPPAAAQVGVFSYLLSARRCAACSAPFHSEAMKCLICNLGSSRTMTKGTGALQ